MTDVEIMLRATVNLLRDSIETGRMPSGLELAPAAIETHEAAAAELERLLASAGPTSPGSIEGGPRSEPHAVTEHPDARLIAICQQMLAIRQEIDDLTDRDPDAPDRGPNQERHDALWEEFAVLRDELTDAAPPTTSEGIQALARLVMLFPLRIYGGTLRPESFGEWLRLVVVTTVAGMGETVPLPD